MNKFKSFVLLVSISGSFFLVGCEDDPITFLPPDEQLEKDLRIIDDYLDEKNIEADIDPEFGLRYVIHEQGDGEVPDLSNQVKVNYEGRLLKNGKVFDDGEDIEFILNQVILGWRIGMRLIQEGGSITIYVPSGYAYGPSGSGKSIPPNANLIFDIDLIEITN